MKRRNRNSLTIREAIRQFFAERSEPANLDEINRFVAERVTLTSKTPRASVFSVMIRMPDVIRTEPSTYMLTRQSRTTND